MIYRNWFLVCLIKKSVSKIGVAYQKSVSKLGLAYQKSVFLMKNWSLLSKIGLFYQRSVFKNRSSLSKIKDSGVWKKKWLGWQFLDGL